MQYSSSALILAVAATNVFGHGVIDSIQGANGVTMPGLSVIQGTPRDCPTPACGSEADTSIIRQNELGTSKATALGRTVGGGPVDGSKMVSLFMGGNPNTTSAIKAREIHVENMRRRGLLDLFGGGGGDAGGLPALPALPGGGASSGGLLGGLLGGGGGGGGGGSKTPAGTTETGVSAAEGAGAAKGLPTTSDDGILTMSFHQVNQDGAGPLSCDVDPTSGGTAVDAFQPATVTQNIPGLGVGGLSTAQTMDFPLAVQMPAGMTCSGTVGGATNVCICRCQNSALAGPFGGSVAFTQSPAAKKRSIEHRLRKRRFARALPASTD